MDLTWWRKFLMMLLPSSTVFSNVKDRFFTALVQAFGTAAKSAHDINGQNLTDLHPDHTTRADEWSEQFGFVSTLTASQLSDKWQETGGQSPYYLQQQLHEAGFTNLYVHEWWEPGSDPVVARNPITYINNGQPNNLLVNYVYSIYEDLPQCGDDYQCGDPLQCGDTFGLKYEEKIYDHPDVAAQYPYYMYVCGETFGDFASLSEAELMEAKRIIYKIKTIDQRVILLFSSFRITEDEQPRITEELDTRVI